MIVFFHGVHPSVLVSVSVYSVSTQSRSQPPCCRPVYYGGLRPIGLRKLRERFRHPAVRWMDLKRLEYGGARRTRDRDTGNAEYDLPRRLTHESEELTERPESTSLAAIGHDMPKFCLFIPPRTA